ncbi:MAG TPA: glycosyltransferase, partial [Verrucomicrobiae bacterium]|nr:glycosyltransferase [Verrucomicrobiae bacterium]
MPAAAIGSPRVTVDGKFFRLGEKKFFPKGVSYGPFPPNAEEDHFATRERTAADFKLIRELGANLLRVYHVPPKWLLDLAAEHALRLLIDIPWNKMACFLDSRAGRDEARNAVRLAVGFCSAHPAVFAFSVVNEIPADIVRWSGARAVTDFIEELVSLAKGIDPECLCTFGNFPTTEFLNPQNVDFYCFNVYLHELKPFESYLARLQMLAEVRPLMLGEFGIDSLREGEAVQAETLAWQIQAVFRGGLAGAVVYSFTDEWYKDGRMVQDWAFGLTTATRRPKEAYQAVQRVFRSAPYFPLECYPMVSVVVASYNGAHTLKACLESLERLNYPAYEVILVDDGSTDQTPSLAAKHPKTRYIRHELNAGLSVARNTGITAARGEIVAFTDADCRADEDWLFYLVGDLLRDKFAGIGGHNLLPPEDSWIAAAVMVSPGGPAHVMLTDRVAEHIPGCNMAFYKWALVNAGCFDPIFRKAGDDVDICWRIQQRGGQIGFSPAGFVWHYRRSAVSDYLKQQYGYGEAEAMLVHKHPEYFNSIGGNLWHGRIYSPARLGIFFRPAMIYHGLFGTGLFQALYSPPPTGLLTVVTSVEYHALVTAPLFVLSAPFGFITPVAVTNLALVLAVCIIAAAQANLPRNKKRFWSRPLVALLFFLQPVVRGWARHKGRLGAHQAPLIAHENLNSVSQEEGARSLEQALYWAEHGMERLRFLTSVLERLDRQGWQNRTDTGWNNYDVEISGSRWSRLRLTTVAEAHKGGTQTIR